VATFDYNPITGQLDLVGAGGGTSYIDGVVADPTALPVTLGSPALDSVYLAKAGSGLWLISRRPAGLYVRVANNGVAADWTYLGAFPEINSSANWELYDGTDPTKELKFDLSSISTGTTRTLTAPNASGRIQVEGQAIGNTTPAAITGTAGAFTTLTANNGTLTASAPVLDLAQTWNNAAVTFTGLRFNVTNTASAAASKPFDFQIGGTSVLETNAVGLTVARRLGASTFANAFEVRRESSLVFSVRDDGAISGANGVNANAAGICAIHPSFGVMLASGLPLQWSNSATTAFTGTDLLLRRDAAGVLSQYNAANPQEYRIYNTFTSSTNHERGFLKWSSNVFQIGTEKGSGGGTARNLEFQTDGVTRFAIAANGNATIGGGLALGWGGGGTRIIGATFPNGLLQLQTGSTDRITIDANGIIGIGGTTASFPALKRSSATLQVRLADDSAFAGFSCGALTLNGNLDASTRDIVTDTTTGTKIGTGTTQKLGFFNATPVVQQAAVADATDAASTQAGLNDLLARLRTLGLIAT
jgi:hypothetical protein